MSEWQTIDTAPRDGTELLVYDPGQGVNQAIWNDDPKAWVDTWEATTTFQPTHWMPLPKPPAAFAEATTDASPPAPKEMRDSPETEAAKHNPAIVMAAMAVAAAGHMDYEIALEWFAKSYIEARFVDEGGAVP